MPIQSEGSIKKQFLVNALSDAAQLIHHPEMAPAFLTFNNSLMKRPIPEPKVWALSMANGYLKHSGGRACIDLCWKACVASLHDQDPTPMLAEFRKQGAPIDPSVAEVLTKAREFLLKNPEDLRWLALVYFCYSRMIAVSSKSAFESNEWSDGDLFLFSMEKAFSAGKGKDFMGLLSNEAGEYFESKEHLQFHIALNAPIGLATMAAIEPNAAFFEGMGIH
jgi:hypothetical protein